MKFQTANQRSKRVIQEISNAKEKDFLRAEMDDKYNAFQVLFENNYLYFCILLQQMCLSFDNTI